MRTHNEVDGYSGPENKETNVYLRGRHGDSYMGFPTYRLIHSSARTTLSAGEWNDWDTNIPVERRGQIDYEAVGHQVAMGRRETSTAERRIIEMRRVETYPDLYHTPGWILERWMAPAYWGSPSEWNGRTVPGTTLPRLGPYPHKGDYMLIGGPYPEAPTGPFLDRLVEQWELMREDVLALATSAYVRKRWYEAEERDKTRSERWNREASAANLTAMQPMFSTFLEGGIARQRAAEHAGLQSNYGN